MGHMSFHTKQVIEYFGAVQADKVTTNHGMMLTCTLDMGAEHSGRYQDRVQTQRDNYLILVSIRD